MFFIRKYTQAEMLRLLTRLEEAYSINPTSKKKTVLQVWEAFVVLVRILKIDPNEFPYLKSTSGAAEISESGICDRIEKLKVEMDQWSGDEWGVFGVVRCLRCCLEHGRIEYPVYRNYLQKILGTGEPSRVQMDDYEDRLFETFVQKLSPLVREYNSQNPPEKILF